MTIHFVYAIPRPQGIRGLHRVFRKYDDLAEQFSILPRWYRYGWLPGLPDPLAAPYSITKHLTDFLRQHSTCLLYDWQERGAIAYDTNDVVLGHPHSNPDTIMYKTMMSNRKCKIKALIFPIHHAMESVTKFVLPLVDRADVVLGIMGPYWYDTLGSSFFAPWKHKIIPLDMAIDANQYPMMKKRFNPPGERGFLHIGYNVPEKGPEVLAATMKRLPEFRKGWIGAGEEIDHISRITPFAYLTPKYIDELARTYDIFVNTSVSDANPTTILEAMAWGFPVACTPQSGYYNMPSLMPLSTTDIDANVEVLTQMQNAPVERLQELSETNRRLIETQYTWDRFCGTVWQALQSFM